MDESVAPDIFRKPRGRVLAVRLPGLAGSMTVGDLALAANGVVSPGQF
jgi:hypothetical protein